MKEKLSGVYCIRNIINNKKYIGISRDIKRRWYEHKYDLRHHTHDNQHLQSAWDKYGETNFMFDIIELCDKDILSEKECYYIKSFQSQSHQNGYNLTHGGENSSTGKPVISLKNGVIYDIVNEAAACADVTPATMIRWCRQKHNYMYLDEYNCLSQDEKDYWNHFDWAKFDHKKLSNAHSRKNLSKETLSKLSKATSGDNNPRSIKVYCPQLDEIFDCIKYATDKYGINRGSISQHLKGKLKSAGKHPVTGEKLTWEIIEK